MAWRRKWLILLSMVAAVCVAVITLAVVPKVYESRVTLLVEDSQLVSAEIEKAMGGIKQAPRRYGNDGERMARMVGRIRSFPFLERVVRLLKMDEDPVIRAEAQKRRQRAPGGQRRRAGGPDPRRGPAGTHPFRGRRLGSGLPGHRRRLQPAERTGAREVDQRAVRRHLQPDVPRPASGPPTQFGSEQAEIYEEQLHRSEEALEDYKKSLIEQDLTRRLVRSENLDRAQALNNRLAEEIGAARQTADGRQRQPRPGREESRRSVISAAILRSRSLPRLCFRS